MARALLMLGPSHGLGRGFAMIAQVRPLRPEYEAASLRHLWGVVLPTDGRHRSRSAFRQSGVVGPAAAGTADRLHRVLDRASNVIPSARLVTVFTRETAFAAGDELATLPGSRWIQPSSRGSAPDVFLAALAVLQHDAHAILATLPANHLIDEGPRLMHYVARAAGAVAMRADLPVVIGAYPEAVDPDSAWVEPGQAMEGLEAFGVHAVRRFVTRPSAVDRASGLLGAVAIVASARTLVTLGRRHVPDVLECLEPLEDVVGRPEAALLCDAVWESMPRASITRDLLALVESLGVVSMPDAMAGERARVTMHALAS